MENRKENFSEWYNEIIVSSDLSDKRYPVKGMNVWLPYGWKIMQLIDGIIRREVDKNNFQEVSFPVLITRDQLDVEFEHIRGFENEIYWVTKGGKEKLDVDLALRPTSESAMYPMFSLWIRSHADLPLKTYQIVSVYRYETKHTRSFIRIREIHFFEAHTAHATYEDAEAQMEEYRRIWKNVSETLGLPYLQDIRPEWDKFPGAVYTLAFDTAMPSNRSLQIGTIHEYGTNFAKSYGPVRIETGVKEVSGSTVTIAMRNIKGKKTVPLDRIVDSVNDAMEKVRERIIENARKDFEKRVFMANSDQDLSAPEGLAVAYWCGSKECSDLIEQKYERAALGFRNDQNGNGKCIICGKDGKMAVFGRSY